MHAEFVEEGGGMPMAAPVTYPTPEIDYPTSDGRPMAETDFHRDLMVELIETLQDRFAPDKMVYVSGNLLVFYEQGNRRRHVSPDVFVVKGVPNHKRKYYLIWQEKKTLDVAIELTSASTRDEDVEDKKQLYQDVLKVEEYFLFDPWAEYLVPQLQGFRLVQGSYQSIEPVEGRLPSETLGVHLEADGIQLRLWDLVTCQWLPTPKELKQLQADKLMQSEHERSREKQARVNAEIDRQQALLARDREAEARRRLEEEIAGLRAQKAANQANPPSQ
jgi:Uma2 family endonuclease